ncbi:hypothetical protein [Chryseobacterium daeguense]|uniref:hypothetical protein n=1 Tax=Chryseobacterium daeguense TaxID=412438 RepID=UPI000482B111|nr:hypothetical protein [Chryseobacterium daeguense]
MSHIEKQKIFDEYADENGFVDWDDLLNDFQDQLMSNDEFNTFLFAACDLVQKEQQKRIVGKLPSEGSALLHNGATKDSILSENNLIK